MANEETKKPEENTEDSSEETQEPSSGGGKKKILLFGGIGLGTVIIGVALALFVIKPMLATDEATEEGDSTTQEHGKDKSKKEKKAKKKKEVRLDSHGNSIGTIIYVVKDIIVNPAGTGGTRFLSVSFGFALESPEMEEMFKQKESIVRDALITIMSSRTVAQLTDAKQKEIIRYQIKKRVMKIMDTDEIEGVYYTSFVLQ